MSLILAPAQFCLAEINFNWQGPLYFNPLDLQQMSHNAGTFYFFLNYFIFYFIFYAKEYSPLPICFSSLFQSESWCKAFHLKIRFIHTHILVHLHVNKTNFHWNERLCTWPCFKTDAKGNSEVAYCFNPKKIVFSFRLMESMPRTTLDQAIRIQVSVHMSLCSRCSNAVATTIQNCLKYSKNRYLYHFNVYTTLIVLYCGHMCIWTHR